MQVLTEWLLGYSEMLFQLQSLYSVKGDGKMMDST